MNRNQATMPALVFALSMLAIPGLAQAQSSAPNLAGTYRCVPEPSSCQWQEHRIQLFLKPERQFSST
jgi:hypothetical protein